MGDVIDAALVVRAVFLLPCVKKLNSHRALTFSRCLKLQHRLVTGAKLMLHLFQPTLILSLYFHENIHQPVVLQGCGFLLDSESLAA